jgi:hypothetical protein
MPRVRIPLMILLACLLRGQCFGQNAKELPDVKTALEQFQASEQEAREKLLDALQRAQDKAAQLKKLDQAASIRDLKDRIAAGDPVPVNSLQLRQSLQGTTWSWHRNWETDGMKVHFSGTEILIEPASAPKQRHKYVVTGSHTLTYEGKMLVFNKGYTKFVAILEGFDYRTGVKISSP